MHLVLAGTIAMAKVSHVLQACATPAFIASSRPPPQPLSTALQGAFAPREATVLEAVRMPRAVMLATTSLEPGLAGEELHVHVPNESPGFAFLLYKKRLN